MQEVEAEAGQCLRDRAKGSTRSAAKRIHSCLAPATAKCRRLSPCSSRQDKRSCTCRNARPTAAMLSFVFCQIGWGPNGFLTQKADLTTTRSSPKKVSLAQTGLEVWPAVGPSERCQLPASPLPAHSKQDLKASVIYAENLAKNLHLFKNALMA